MHIDEFRLLYPVYRVQFIAQIKPPSRGLQASSLGDFVAIANEYGAPQGYLARLYCGETVEVGEYSCSQQEFDELIVPEAAMQAMQRHRFGSAYDGV